MAEKPLAERIAKLEAELNHLSTRIQNLEKEVASIKEGYIAIKVKISLIENITKYVVIPLLLSLLMTSVINLIR